MENSIWLVFDKILKLLSNKISMSNLSSWKNLSFFFSIS